MFVFGGRWQLRGMAEAVKKTIKQALTQQEKRIAETEERRSEIEVNFTLKMMNFALLLNLKKMEVRFKMMDLQEQQLQQSLSLIASKVIESEQRINKQVSKCDELLHQKCSEL